MSTQQDNSGLYFIVGLLVAVVAVFGFIMFSDNGSVQNIEPAAGIEETADETSSTFKLDVDDNSITGTTTTEESE